MSEVTRVVLLVVETSSRRRLMSVPPRNAHLIGLDSDGELQFRKFCIICGSLSNLEANACQHCGAAFDSGMRSSSVPDNFRTFSTPLPDPQPYAAPNYHQYSSISEYSERYSIGDFATDVFFRITRSVNGKWSPLYLLGVILMCIVLAWFIQHQPMQSAEFAPSAVITATPQPTVPPTLFSLTK